MGFDQEDDDRLGYGHPPTWTRFRKGVSGNPKGRPKKNAVAEDQIIDLGDDPASDYVLRRELNRLIKVRDGHVERQLTVRELAQRAQSNAALKGNVMAQRDLLNAARSLDDRDAQRREAALAKKRNQFRAMVRWKEIRQWEWADAVARGQEPEDPWPHPDDIIINDDTQDAFVRGPYNRRNVPFYEYIRAQRDVGLIEDVLRSISQKKSPLAQMWKLIWLSFGLMLPLRWQVSSTYATISKNLFFTPVKELKRQHQQHTEVINRLAPQVLSDKYEREGYDFANGVLRPVLKKMGYRSLAHFERAYADTNGEPPWPRITGPSHK